MARASCVALVGMEATIVEVEAWTGSGLPRTCMVGLPDATLTQAKERVRAGVISAGYPWPQQVLTINLLPASLPKTGSHYDVGIAAAVLAAQGRIDPGALADKVLFGEIGLDGTVHCVRGIFPALLGARRLGITTAIVPASQMGEAALVEDMAVFGAGCVNDVVDILAGGPGADPEPPAEIAHEESDVPDLRDVVGLSQAKWALEVAAAGRHHVCFHGPPGVGKTMLASCLPGILPDLTIDEAMEVAAIQSLAGTGHDRLPLRPPFAAPHHCASLASLVGGGARVARPGAVSLAHRGVLFLDEAPEFSPHALEALRVPLESGMVRLGRSEAVVTYPAKFQLVMAANPCPCGMSGVPSGSCTCPPMAVRRYASRVSGPILDRIDIQAPIMAPAKALLRVGGGGECSADVADRVRQARDRQRHRLTNTAWTTNAEVPGSWFRARGLGGAEPMVEQAVSKGMLSARGVDKVMRIAWTLADLASDSAPSVDQVRLALAMRQGEEIR